MSVAGLSPDERLRRQLAFDAYFATIHAWAYHPGTTRDAPERRSVDESAQIALDMLTLRDKLEARGVI